MAAVLGAVPGSILFKASLAIEVVTPGFEKASSAHEIKSFYIFLQKRSGEAFANEISFFGKNGSVFA